MSEPILCLDLDGAFLAAPVLAEAGYEVLRASSLEQARRLVRVQGVAAVVASGSASAAAAGALSLPTVRLMRSSDLHFGNPANRRDVSLRGEPCHGPAGAHCELHRPTSSR